MKRISAFFLFLAACVLVLSCTLPGFDSLYTVRLPRVSAVRQMAFGWNAWVLVRPGQPDEVIDTSVESLVVDCPRGMVIPLLLYPQSRDGYLLEPAGCILPGPDPEFTWFDGPRTLVAERFASLGGDLHFINLDRLDRELAKRCPDDPWDADIYEVLERFALGGMRSDLIRPVRREAVYIDAQGIWIPSNPFENMLSIPSGGCQVDVKAGMGIYYREDGSERLVIQCEEDIVTTALFPVRDE